MEKKHTDLGHRTPRGPAAATTADDPWVGEDSAWLDEADRLHPRLDGHAEEDQKVISFFRIAVMSVALGAGVWALIGYGVYRLVAG
jgi:hypothetical protein